jgi:hypothetical protein
MPEEITAAINANPDLRIELDLIRPVPEDGGKAYFYADSPPPWDPRETVVLSIPEQLWAQLGRRGRIVAQLSIEDDE